MYNLIITVEIESWLAFGILVSALEQRKRKRDRYAVAYAVEACGYLILFELKTMWKGI